MGQVSPKLRRGETAYFHWCPACDERHPLPDSWAFNGDLVRPSFTPSFKHTRHKYDSYTPEGRGIGERRTVTCHYILTDGVLNFCTDCTHALAGHAVPLPDLPAEARDP